MSPFDAGWRRRVWTVFAKEMRDHGRDKRSILLSMIFPLLAPLVVGLLLKSIAVSNVDGERELAISAMVAGDQHAPELTAYLKDHGVSVRPAPADRAAQERMVSRGQEPFVLIIPPEAAGQERFSLTIIVDRANPRSTAGTTEIMRRIREFGRQTSVRLIEARGLDAGVVTPVTVEEVNVGRPPNTAHLFYGMVPPLVMFMIFMGAVYLAIDVTVGERERGSLEPLFTAPVARWELLLGKACAAWVFTAAILAINLTAFRLSLTWATAGAPELAAPPGTLAFVSIYLTALPLVALAVTVQMSIAAITRSAKEAQIYLGLLPIIPLIPGLIMVFNPVRPSLATATVPLFGQMTLFADVIAGHGVPLGLMAVATAVTLVAAIVWFVLAARLFEREKLVFAA